MPIDVATPMSPSHEFLLETCLTDFVFSDVMLVNDAQTLSSGLVVGDSMPSTWKTSRQDNTVAAFFGIISLPSSADGCQNVVEVTAAVAGRLPDVDVSLCITHEARLVMVPGPLTSTTPSVSSSALSTQELTFIAVVLSARDGSVRFFIRGPDTDPVDETFQINVAADETIDEVRWIYIPDNMATVSLNVQKMSYFLGALDSSHLLQYVETWIPGKE